MKFVPIFAYMSLINIYTCIYVYTGIYAHTRYYMYIYIHIRIYVHIHTYTYICKISANSGRELFLRGCSRRPRASGWTPTGQICCGGPWDWIIMRGSCIGDLQCETRGALQGPRTRAAGWGAPNRVFTTFADGRNKWMLRCSGMP